MIYDAETNIACIEVSTGTIDHTVELGNFIIHVSKTKIPILIEILEASNFVGQFNKNEAEAMEKLKKVLPANLFELKT
ncbi:MAG: DUF2283 domain-containing protein [Patescibacteria group bacterium]|nr:DUF2283 domain-containing protein [Patescibacteria group bacterium]